MATTIRVLVAELLEAGFTLKKGGKGSHRKFKHAPSGQTAMICHHDGDDAPDYLIKQVRQKISKATAVGE